MTRLRISVFLSLFGILHSCAENASIAKYPAEPAPFRIIGFYHGSHENVGEFEYSKLTHVIFCFAKLEGNKISIKDSLDETTLRKLVEQKKTNPDLKVLVSLGGWGGCETCSPVFAEDSNRIIFAKSVRVLLTKYHADGFDLDWESPVIGGYNNHPASANDKENFTELMIALRKELPPPYEISFDANSFPEFVLQSIDWENVMPQVDFVNLMTYGLPNDKPGHTGHHTALYSSPFQKESVNSGVILLDSLHVPLHKIVIGAGFYGFVVESVDADNFGLGGKGKSKGSPTFRVIQEKYSASNGYETHWDSVAMAPWLYSDSAQTFVTFDNPQSCKLKTEYAIRKKLGGIMFWKLNGDLGRNGLLDAIYEASRRTGN